MEPKAIVREFRVSEDNLLDVGAEISADHFVAGQFVDIQGRTQGKVVERKTSDFEFDGQKFTASKDEPAFIVESEKTGKQAAHKGSALNKLKS